MNARDIIRATERAATGPKGIDWGTAFGILCHELRAACHELATMRGDNAMAQPGCSLGLRSLGDAKLLIEYELLPGSRPTWTEPGEPASARILSVFVNGCWLDAGELGADLIERWEHELLQGFEPARRAA